MALLWIEGFESFGQTNGNNPTGIQQKYDVFGLDVTGFTIRDGRVAGKSLRFGNAQSTLGKIFAPPSGSSTITMGFGFMRTGHLGNATIIFWDGLLGAKQGGLEIQTDGTWKYFKGGGMSSQGSSLGQSSGSNIVDNTWAYIEIKIKIHSSTGTVDIWVDGNNVLSLTGQNTQNTANNFFNEFIIVGNGNGDNCTFDDIYVLDDTGSVNNSRLGARLIKMIVPASDAGTNQFTPDSGSTHYNRLTEAPRDTTTYLEDNTTGHRELFGMGTLNLATVAGLQMNTLSLVTGNAIRSIKNSIHTSGGTDSDDTAEEIADGANYQTHSRMVEVNPETSALWTPSQINAAQFGFKVG